MKQIGNTITQKSLIIFLIPLLLLFSCNQNSEKRLKQEQPNITQNKFSEDLEKVDDFDDLARHLNDYKSLWKSIGIDWDYANDAVLSIRRWEENGFLRQVSDDSMLAIINDLPKEGDLRGLVFDLWKESQRKSITKK
jgi:hypothetical protein